MAAEHAHDRDPFHGEFPTPPELRAGQAVPLKPGDISQS
jgi:hypothetical protein